jgi:hypothetical protein
MAYGARLRSLHPTAGKERGLPPFCAKDARRMGPTRSLQPRPQSRGAAEPIDFGIVNLATDGQPIHSPALGGKEGRRGLAVLQSPTISTTVVFCETLQNLGEAILDMCPHGSVCDQRIT